MNVAGGDVVEGASVAAFVNDDKVIFEAIGGGILNDELAMKVVRAEGEAVVANDSVIEDTAMDDTAAVAVVATDGKADFIVMVEEVITDNDVARDPSGVFGTELDSDITFCDDVTFDDDILAAIGVDAGGVAAAVGRAGAGDAVTDAAAIARAARGVDGGFTADHVDADVVDVVDDVAKNKEVGDIAVEGEGFAGGGLAVTDVVVGDNDIGVRSCLGTVDGDSHAVSTADPVDGVAYDVEVGAASFKHDGGAALAGGGFVAADMEAVYLNEGDVVAVKKVGARRVAFVTTVDEDAFTRSCAQDDGTLRSVAAAREEDAFVVGAGAYSDCVARECGVKSGLNGRVHATGFCNDQLGGEQRL